MFRLKIIHNLLSVFIGIYFMLAPHLALSATQPEIFVPIGHVGPVNALEWSPDGRFILSASDDKTSKLWDVESGRLIRTFEDGAEIICLSFLPGNKSMFTLSNNGIVSIWDILAGQRIREFSLGKDKSALINDPVAYDGAILRGIVSDQLFMADVSGETMLPLPNLPDKAPFKSNMPGFSFGDKNIITADGKRMLSSVRDDSSEPTPDNKFRKIIFHELFTGKIISTLSGHQDRINVLVLSPNEVYAASGSRDKTVRVWDLKSGKAIGIMTGHQQEIEALSFSVDQKYLLSASRDNTMKLWSIESGKIIRTFTNNCRVTLVRFSPDERFAVSGDAQGAIKMWDIKTGEVVRILKGYAADVSAVSLSADGRTFLTGSSDGKIRIWDAASGKMLKSIQDQPEGINSVRFTPDGRLVLSAGSDKTLKLWDMADGKLLRTFVGHKDQVYQAAISPDGAYILSLAGRSGVRLWNLSTGVVMEAFQFPGKVSSIGFSKDGGHLVIAYDDKQMDTRMIKVLTLSGREVRRYINNGLHYSDDGNYFLSNEYWELTDKGKKQFDPDAGQKKSKWYLDSVRKSNLVDIANGKVISRFGQSGAFVSLSTCAEEGIVLTKNRYDEDIRLWDVRTGLEIRRFPAKHGLIAYDGRKVITPASKTLQAFDRATGRSLKSFSGAAAGDISALALSANGAHAVTGDTAGFIQFWDVGGSALIKTIQAQEKEMIVAVAFSPDRRYAASLSRFGMIKIWNTTDGQKLSEFKTDYAPMYSEELDLGEYLDYGNGILAFSPDGRQIACGDGIWEAASGKEVIKFSKLNVPYPWVAFSPDGGRLLSRNMIWDISSGSVVQTMERMKTGVKSFYSAEGKFIYSADLEGGFYVVNSDNGALVRKFANFVPPGVFDVSNNNKVMIAVENDQQDLTFWDLASGKKNATFKVNQAIFGVRLTIDDQPRALLKHGFSIREYDLNAGGEIARFIGFTDGEWIVVTPEGYYNASAGGDKYLNVRAGERIYGIGNYREAFFRPNLVQKALSGSSLNGFRKLSDVRKPPIVQIVDTPETVNVDEVNVRLSLDEQGGGIGDIRLYLNGTAVVLDSGSSSSSQNADQAIFKTYVLKPALGKNIIKAVAANVDNTMQSNAALWETTANYAQAEKSSFNALVVGINDFINPQLKLTYSVADAELLAATLQTAAAGLFEKVTIKTLTKPDQTTGDAILQEIKAFQSMRPDDLFVLYLAGHGLVDEDQYFFIPSNVDSLRTEKLKIEAISQKKLAEAIANLPATKKLLLIDTCNSLATGESGPPETSKSKMNEDTALRILSRILGVTVIAGSKLQNEALEGYQGHGLFVHVLAEGLKGKANKSQTGYIQTDELGEYMAGQLPQLSDNIFKRVQYPTISVGGQSFPVGKVQ